MRKTGNLSDREIQASFDVSLDEEVSNRLDQDTSVDKQGREISTNIIPNLRGE